MLIGGGPSPKGKEEGTVMLLEATPQALEVRMLGAAGGEVLARVRLEAPMAPAAAQP